MKSIFGIAALFASVSNAAHLKLTAETSDTNTIKDKYEVEFAKCTE